MTTPPTEALPADQSEDFDQRLDRIVKNAGNRNRTLAAVVQEVNPEAAALTTPMLIKPVQDLEVVHAYFMDVVDKANNGKLTGEALWKELCKTASAAGFVNGTYQKLLISASQVLYAALHGVDPKRMQEAAVKHGMQFEEEAKLSSDPYGVPALLFCDYHHRITPNEHSNFVDRLGVYYSTLASGIEVLFRRRFENYFLDDGYKAWCAVRDAVRDQHLLPDTFAGVNHAVPGGAKVVPGTPD